MSCTNNCTSWPFPWLCGCGESSAATPSCGCVDSTQSATPSCGCSASTETTLSCGCCSGCTGGFVEPRTNIIRPTHTAGVSCCNTGCGCCGGCSCGSSCDCTGSVTNGLLNEILTLLQNIYCRM